MPKKSRVKRQHKKHTSKQRLREKYRRMNEFMVNGVKSQLRFITYMTEENTQNFFDVLCNMEDNNCLTVKFTPYYQYHTVPTCIEVYVPDKQLGKVESFLNYGALATVGGRSFRGVVTHSFRSRCNVSTENRMLVSLLSNEETQAFVYDLHYLQKIGIEYTAILEHQITDDYKVVELYAQDEAVATPLMLLLQNGPFGKKWKHKFINVYKN